MKQIIDTEVWNEVVANAHAEADYLALAQVKGHIRVPIWNQIMNVRDLIWEQSRHRSSVPPYHISV